MSTDFISDFSNIKADYYLRISDNSSYKSFVSDQDLYDAFQIFCKEFKNYIQSVLKNKIFTDRELADYIFQFSFKTKTQYKEYIRRSLFACQQYIEHYQSTINIQNIERYHKLLSIIHTDIEDLVGQTEVYYKNTQTKVELNSWRKFHKEPRDIFSVVKTLFFIDDIEKPSDIYSFDVRPYSIFPIRQLIEIYGKEILGFDSIIDNNGNFSKKHLNSAWDFIELEIKKGKLSRIELPFDIIPILKIQKWSNRFVHTTFDAPYYIIFKAIDILTNLFKVTQNWILCYDGKRYKKSFATIKITNYDSLKSDFESYVNQKSSNSTNNYTVNWKHINSLSSYIISL